MPPATVEAPARSSVTAPPLVARLPIAAPPVVVVMLSAPPAVVIVSPALIEKVPERNDTERPAVWAKFRLPPARGLITMLLVAARETLVVAAMPSSSDWKSVVG